MMLIDMPPSKVGAVFVFSLAGIMLSLHTPKWRPEHPERRNPNFLSSPGGRACAPLPAFPPEEHLFSDSLYFMRHADITQLEPF